MCVECMQCDLSPDLSHAVQWVFSCYLNTSSSRPFLSRPPPSLSSADSLLHASAAVDFGHKRSSHARCSLSCRQRSPFVMPRASLHCLFSHCTIQDGHPWLTSTHRVNKTLSPRRMSAGEVTQHLKDILRDKHTNIAKVRRCWTNGACYTIRFMAKNNKKWLH